MSDTPAMLQLLSPDGYYQYLGIRKPDANGAAAGETAAETVDEDMVRKNYRRLTLKHHPDRPNGDAETFRVLTRAKKVLTNSRLRQQYDLLGLDLDDDDDQATHGGNAGGDGDHDVDKNSEHNGSDNTGSNAGGEEDGDDQDQLPQTVLAEMASMTLAAMLQVIIRTVIMGLVAVLVVRYRLLLYPAMAFLCYVAYRIHVGAQQAGIQAPMMDMAGPFIRIAALFLMYRGRLDGATGWNWSFWIGESLALFMFLTTSITISLTMPLQAVLGVFATLASLYLRGNPWNYGTILLLEAVALGVTSVAFPVMDMVLEQIMNEKLRKIGEKIRAQGQRMEGYYREKYTGR